MQYLVIERHDYRRTAIAKGAVSAARSSRSPDWDGTPDDEMRRSKTLHTPRCLQAVSGEAELARI
jgi:hypothetical protein